MVHFTGISCAYKAEEGSIAFVQNHVIQDDLLYEVKVFTDGRTGEV